MSNSHASNDYHRLDLKEGQSPYVTKNTDYKQKSFERDHEGKNLGNSCNSKQFEMSGVKKLV